jgi:hypothetical protein
VKTALAPVSALFFLEQGPENRVDELSSAEAVRRLMRNILFFAEDHGWWKSSSPRLRFCRQGSHSPPDVLS